MDIQMLKNATAMRKELYGRMAPRMMGRRRQRESWRSLFAFIMSLHAQVALRAAKAAMKKMRFGLRSSMGVVYGWIHAARRVP